MIADIARLCGYDEIAFLDDNPNLRECMGYPVVGNSEMSVEGDIFVAIGNAGVRRKLMERSHPVTLVHPSAVVADGVQIGEGSVVMAGAVINPGVSIGRGCIVNTCASVDHDCVVADYTHISVGAHLCGCVCVGEETWVGAGATVSNNVTICGGVIIGAGAVVIKNIEKEGTYVGVPAKRIKESPKCE